MKCDDFRAVIIALVACAARLAMVAIIMVLQENEPVTV